jgi:hypothetical protein
MKFFNIRTPWQRTLLTIILLLVFYFALSYIAHMLCTIDYYSTIEYFRYFYLASAGITGFLYILLKGIRSWRKNLVSAIQIVLIFSALPYILFNFLFPPLDAVVFLTFPGIILFVFVTILPEFFGFFGFAFLKRRKSVPTIAFWVLAAALFFEMHPLRTSWRFDFDAQVIHRIYNPEDNQPFCTNNRETEIKRSVQTILDLEARSENSPSGNTVHVRFNIPNLEYRPDMLKPDQEWQWGPYKYWDDANHPAFIKKIVTIDTTVDSDDDGLTDFKEIILLSDAYNKDTDGDGVQDGIDSDPLNPMIESEIGELNAAIIEYWISTWYTDEEEPWLCEVNNYFHKGRGEVANFGNHILIINGDHSRLWYRMFNGVFPFGVFHYHIPNIHIGRQLLDIFGIIAIVDVSCYAGAYMYVLVKWQNKWQVIAGRLLWIS